MGPQAPIRVLIADDHAVVRSGLATFLLAFDDLEIVGQAANGREAVEQALALRPDVVLMDLQMPVLDGVAAIRALRAQLPEVPVIALTSFREDALVRAAIEAGAAGYLLKHVSADDLAAAIRTVWAGEPVLSPEATQALVRTVAAPSPPAAPDLTAREREVLALLVEGLSTAAIAARLEISAATVKFHTAGILAKLGVSSRAEAVARAVRQHLVP